MNVLDIRSLHVNLALTRGTTPIVNGVDLTIKAGEVRGLVGESGAGKTMVARTILGTLPRRARNVRGQILFNDEDILTMSPRRHRALLRRDIALIPQDPMIALNPVYTIGHQFRHVLRRFTSGKRTQLDSISVELMNDVSLKYADTLLDKYPHELSGGMRQRVLIAMAFASRPSLVVADEPTTALDVTVQKRVLALLRQMQARNGTAILFVTHDLGVVAKLCNSVSVMRNGRVIESGSCERIIKTPQEPYTQSLLQATPRYDRPVETFIPPNPMAGNNTHNSEPGELSNP